jgi:hypothetical protein
MDRTCLLAEITAANAQPGDVLYLERRGAEYHWRLAAPDAAMAAQQEPAADAWMFYSGPWPSGRPDGMPAFLDELLAEMESMCGGADRCRWPLDQPYPFRH